mmetsp:Transcript_74191/g.222975  ORF Transcript_74191/g.222975 Transcript_74191/m.222975 type:complete len:410 (-) Transcript_74191:185-1414(-)
MHARRAAPEHVATRRAQQLHLVTSELRRTLERAHTARAARRATPRHRRHAATATTEDAAGHRRRCRRWRGRRLWSERGASLGGRAHLGGGGRGLGRRDGRRRRGHRRQAAEELRLLSRAVGARPPRDRRVDGRGRGAETLVASPLEDFGREQRRRRRGVQPRVGEALNGGGALVGIDGEQGADETDGLARDVLPRGAVEERRRRTLTARVRLAHWGRAAEQHVTDAPDRPEVDFHRVPVRAHFGRDVVHRAARRAHDAEGPARRLLAHPEVAQLDPPARRHAVARRRLGAQDVLRLDVAVADAVRVHVRDGGEELLHDGGGLRLCEHGPLRDVVHQLAAVDRLGDEQQPVVAPQAAVEGRDVWVVELGPDDGLRLALPQHPVRHRLQVDHLDRRVLTRRWVLRLKDRAK